MSLQGAVVPLGPRIPSSVLTWMQHRGPPVNKQTVVRGPRAGALSLQQERPVDALRQALKHTPQLSNWETLPSWAPPAQRLLMASGLPLHWFHHYLSINLKLTQPEMLTELVRSDPAIHTCARKILEPEPTLKFRFRRNT